jgi:hypothetical protein
MWNHAPEMWKRMQAQQLARPDFSNQEMADLIAWLYTERFFEAAGSAGRGRQMFSEKGCASCHDAAGGRSLARLRGSASPASLAAALWNHGPLMLEEMRKRRIAWPRFRPGEMIDLMEYLNRGAPVAVAEAKGAR